MYRTFILLSALLLTTLSFSQSKNNDYVILLNGNGYVTDNPDGAQISSKGLANWTNEKSVIKTFVYFPATKNLKLSIQGNASCNSTISFSFLNKTKKVNISKSSFNVPLGNFTITKAGYYPLTLKGLKKSGKEFAEIISFTALTDIKPVYVHDFSDYWGRRGPSVHFNYRMPKDTVEWFYNEVTVPAGTDVIGSYYMANGFGEGYFGMQYNSEKERRVLFSVWSPHDTQNPADIPENLKIKMLRRGKDVHIGEFGNEGAGGQSFLRYNWKSGNTYRFLTHIKPDGKGNTVYTSYFYAPEESSWRLIASFLRPETNTYYKRAHSFLENFIPQQGYLMRQVYFGNQWYRTKNGKWIENTEASFSHDATAKAGVRLDYQGGYNKEENKFYLKNGGFFNESTTFGTHFERKRENKIPEIDWESLKKL